MFPDKHLQSMLRHQSPSLMELDRKRPQERAQTAGSNTGSRRNSFEPEPLEGGAAPFRGPTVSPHRQQLLSRLGRALDQLQSSISPSLQRCRPGTTSGGSDADAGVSSSNDMSHYYLQRQQLQKQQLAMLELQGGTAAVSQSVALPLRSQPRTEPPGSPPLSARSATESLLSDDSLSPYLERTARGDPTVHSTPIVRVRKDVPEQQGQQQEKRCGGDTARATGSSIVSGAPESLMGQLRALELAASAGDAMGRLLADNQ